MTEKMTNEEFKRMWQVLDAHVKVRTGDAARSLSDFTEAGVLDVAERLKIDLEDFCVEYVARAKARFETVKGAEETLRKRFGGEKFDAVDPEWSHDLDFTASR